MYCNSTIMANNNTPCLTIPTEKMLEKLIIEEEQIRMSQEYQEECTKVKDIPNGWLEVTNQMQIDLVKKHGFTSEMNCDIACNMLRRARYLYPNNKIFTEVPVYVKNNKANKGKYKKGDNIPNIKLFNQCGQEAMLHHLLDINKPTIIFGGSHT